MCVWLWHKNINITDTTLHIIQCHPNKKQQSRKNVDSISHDGDVTNWERKEGRGGEFFILVRHQQLSYSLSFFSHNTTKKHNTPSSHSRWKNNFFEYIWHSYRRNYQIRICIIHIVLVTILLIVTCSAFQQSLIFPLLLVGLANGREIQETIPNEEGTGNCLIDAWMETIGQRC